ncbi:MAG TPA: tetratricopeptide repeat protein [Bryobacteraceae bacterium]|nr:tetratricopeptide repeat protein [Bryobacteraceae bacterium]
MARITQPISILAAAMVIAAGMPMAAQPGAEEQLAAAIHSEVVIGDLAGAVQQYRSIVARAGTPRAVSARALLQIGLCQEKLGQRKEAYDTYRRLVTDYGDQTEIAARVRTKIEAWSGPRNLKFDEGLVGKVPPGWFVPSLPKDADFLAELRRGEGCHSRAGCAVVMAPRNVPRPVGNLMQSFSAAAYTGKTVRLRARLRLETLFVAGFGVRFPEPDDRAQMWLNVERANRRTGFSDNMDDRPVRGNEWTMCEIVGDIGEDARFINFGVMSIGGRVWVDDVSFDVIPRAAH